MKQRLAEYFAERKNLREYTSVARVPSSLFRQERDWTCSVACVRTLLSGVGERVPSENAFIKKYHLVAGDHFVEEIIEKQMFPQYLKIKTYADFPQEELNLELLCKLLNENYFIMAETIINGDHWVVVLGYYAVRDKKNPEEHQILIYDPYYDAVRLVIADEFETMWCSPKGKSREFIAISK
jgi:hypothetical protein